MNKIGINMVKNLYDYVVHDQRSFNRMFQQVSVGNYKIRSGIRSLYVNTGVYSYQGVLDAFGDTETEVEVDINNLGEMYLEPGAEIDKTGVTLTIDDIPLANPKKISDLTDAPSEADMAEGSVGQILALNDDKDGFILASAAITPLNALDLFSIADLNDVDSIAGVVDGNVLAWDIDGFAPVAPAITALTDVDLSGIADGDLLVYDTDGFIKLTPPYLSDITTESISDLSDVTAAVAPADGDVLIWNTDGFVAGPAPYLEDITSESVDDLSDVSAAAPNDKDTLQWATDTFVAGPFTLTTGAAPANDAAGVVGQIILDVAGDLYICVKNDQTANSWRKITIADIS